MAVLRGGFGEERRFLDGLCSFKRREQPAPVGRQSPQQAVMRLAPARRQERGPPRKAAPRHCACCEHRDERRECRRAGHLAPAMSAFLLLAAVMAARRLAQSPCGGRSLRASRYFLRGSVQVGTCELSAWHAQ